MSRYKANNGGSKNVKTRITDRIKRSRNPVFMPSDFKELGSPSAIGRALRELRNDGLLLNLSRGVYVRAKKSTISGRIVPDVTIQSAMNIFLRKTGREPALSYAEQEYNAGKSTQVPVGRVIGYKGNKISRRFFLNGKSFIFQNVA